jgi:hypothetical protein
MRRGLKDGAGSVHLAWTYRRLLWLARIALTPNRLEETSSFTLRLF